MTEEDRKEMEVTDKHIAFINMLTETVNILEDKVRSSAFITNVIISLFDKDFISDMREMKEFLNEIKDEVNQLRKDWETGLLEEEQSIPPKE